MPVEQGAVIQKGDGMIVLEDHRGGEGTAGDAAESAFGGHMET